MANTSFSYLYRDASNWKQYETIVLAGEMSEDDIDSILSKLEDQNLFLPEQVGLPRLQVQWNLLDDDDHIWHELSRSDIKILDLPTSSTMTAKELVENFRKILKWDIQGSFLRLQSETKLTKIYSSRKNKDKSSMSGDELRNF